MNKTLHCIGLLNAAVTNGESMTPELVQARKDAYAELEGIKDDLELATAVKKFCENEPDKLFYYDYSDNQIEITPDEFVLWYRENFKGEF